MGAICVPAAASGTQHRKVTDTGEQEITISWLRAGLSQIQSY